MCTHSVILLVFIVFTAIFRNDVKSLEKYTRILKDEILVSSEEGNFYYNGK